MDTYPASEVTQQSAPTAQDKDTGAASTQPLRQWISQGFSRIEDVVYVGLGLLSEMLKMGTNTFRNAMLEWGMLTFLIMILVASLYLFRKQYAAETVARE